MSLLPDLDRLSAAATKGPWTVCRCQFADEAPDFACGLNDSIFDASRDECHHTVALADAQFIVALVNSWPSIRAVIAACVTEQETMERLGAQFDLAVPGTMPEDEPKWQEARLAIKARIDTVRALRSLSATSGGSK
jgi:hypothetical protein